MKPDKIEKYGQEINNVINLNELVVYYALELWKECPDDFCIQFVDVDCIIFGSVNRVKWTPKRGFSIDRSYCTKKFIEHYERIMK
jgi:hypothetical protein